jgi:hypothetical protein
MSEPLTDLENALKALTPAPAALDRDRLMFRAGQTSQAHRGLLWKCTAGMFASVSLVLVLILALRPAAQERIVYRDRPVPSPEHSPAPKNHEPPPSSDAVPTVAPDTAVPALAYYRLQQQVNRFGVEALPPVSDPGAPTNEPPVTVPRMGKVSPTTPMNFFPWQN